MMRRSWTRRIDITESVAFLGSNFVIEVLIFQPGQTTSKSSSDWWQEKSGSPSSSSQPLTLRVYIFINQLSSFWNSNLKYANYTAVVSIARPPLKKEKYLENRG